jgi:DNA-binding response OmpR family regulator
MLVDGPKTVTKDELIQPEPPHEVVLLVDDNALQAATRQAILQRVGYIVHIALDPAIALQQLRQNEFSQPIDAVISDHIMPQMSGSEFVRELRQTHSDLAVMVLSGMDDVEHEYAGLNVRFLHKPLSPGLLLINLQALLREDAIEVVA